MAQMSAVNAKIRDPYSDPEDSTGLAHDAPTVGPEYLARNRTAWESWARDYAAIGRAAWTDSELRWGVWQLPESELGVLEGIGAQQDVIELGCGTASVSAWLTRYGHRVAGVDFARAQLDNARWLQDDLGVAFRLVHANVEKLPYDSGSFDVAISEYGASLWSDPRYWLPEAYRVLRPGGKLIFFTNGAMLMACTPPDGSQPQDVLVRDSFTSPIVEFASGPLEFHLRHGLWIEVLRECGFDLEALVEVRPPLEAKARFGFVSLEWARRWPSEEIWIAGKRA
jgi:SAM-dependent methyltransferase